MEDVTKNMTDLFDLAKNAKVDYPISNIASVISGSAATGAVGGATSFFNLSNIVIMIGSVITAVTVFIMVNPAESNPITAENQAVISKQETVKTKEMVTGWPEKELIEENELKSVLPIDEDSVIRIMQEVIVVENIINDVPEPIAPESNRSLPGSNIASFHSVNLNISANVIILKGDKSEVSFNGSEELESMLDMDVDNNVLSINVKREKQREFSKYSNQNGVDIYLTMVEVKDLIINGSGDIYSEDDVPSDELMIQINGSGDVKLDKILPAHFTISVNGSGDVSLYGDGDVEDGEININGSGDVCTRSIDVSKMTIRIVGSGDVAVTCNEKLEVTIRGSGDVCYSGNAELNTQELGSGEVQHCD